LQAAGHGAVKTLSQNLGPPVPRNRVKLLKLVKNDKNAKQLFEMTGEGATSSVLEDIKHSYRILQLLCRCYFKIMYAPVDNPHNHQKKRSGQVKFFH
jgi:hypothetical protein